LKSQKKNIADTVDACLCTSCGTCVPICPTQAISMKETPGGLLFARVDDATCNGCGLCLRGCGGRYLAEGLLPDNVDPFKGKVLAAYCGFANDSDIRLHGQSGGVVTALLSFLLETGRADKALVNHMPEDGTLRPAPYMAHKKEALLHSQGSKYCPVALNAAIPPAIGKDGKKIAVVGLPCHLHSLRNVQTFNPYWEKGVCITVGLFCDRTLAYSAIDYLIGKGKVAPKNVMAFRYREKTQGGWPGTIQLRTKSGKEIRLPSKERQSVKDYFTPPRCRLCFDKVNVLSDISVGDAWGVNEGNEGFSVLLARTAAGLALLQEAQNCGYLTLESIDPEIIFKGQAVEKRRQLWTAFSEERRINGDPLPQYPIRAEFYEKNIENLKDFVASQCRWNESNFKGRETKKIIRNLNFRQFIWKIRRKINL
jgi:coenzyme F420 hydrogenase subunit beta